MKKMAISLGELISRFAPKSTRPTEPSVFSGHERLLKYYGIPPDSLSPGSDSRITRIETRDGDLVIRWNERAIVPPLKYYSSQTESAY